MAAAAILDLFELK